MSWAHSSESEQSIQGLDRNMESGEREDDVNLQEDEGEADDDTEESNQVPGLLLPVLPAQPGGVRSVRQTAHEGGAQSVRHLTHQQDDPGVRVVEIENLSPGRQG